jgi:hypothetical protein
VKIANDLLDKQLLDREKRKAGRVDGLIVELRDDEPPHIVAIECGFAVCAARVSERWSRFAIAVGKKLGVRKTPRYRIPWEKVLDVGFDIEVDVDGPESPMMAWETWWRRRVLSKVPSK